MATPPPTQHRAAVLPRSPHAMGSRCYSVRCTCGWWRHLLTKRGAKRLATQHMNDNTDTAPVVNEEQPMTGPFGRL